MLGPGVIHNGDHGSVVLEGLRDENKYHYLIGPYVSSTVLVQVIAATEDVSIPSVELLCKTANEMWIAIERLQQEAVGNQKGSNDQLRGAREIVGSQRKDDDVPPISSEPRCSNARLSKLICSRTRMKRLHDRIETHYSSWHKIQEVSLPEESSSTEQPFGTEYSRALGEATSCRDSCLIALQNKQNELEKYIAFNDRTIDYEILQTKLNDTLRLLALKDIEIKEGLKTKAYEISVLNQKHDELVRKSLLTKSQFEGQLKEKSKVISDLKSIQTIHMLAPKCSTYNGSPTFANPRYLKDVNARTKKPKVVPISASKPKRKANKSVATPHKKTVASDTTIQKSKSYYKELYENTNQEWKWWIAKRCPSGYKWTQKPLRTKKIWMPKIRKEDVSTSISPTIDIVSRITNIVQLILFIVDSGCTKHMTGNLKLLCNFVEKFLGTVRFGNDQFAPILGYGDLNQGNVTIKRVYYVEGLNHNLFSVGQFCDADLEVAFRKSTCFVRDLQGNDLLTANRKSDLYTISLQETTSSTPIGFMAKASPTQAWLWHRRLSHLNFDYITLLSKKDVVTGLPKLKYVKDQLCSSCEMSKAKRSSFKSKAVPSSKGRLNLLHMDLCGPMRDETLEVLKDFLMMIQRNLQAQVISVRTDRGTEFLNKTLHAYFKEEGIEHQTSIPRTPEQNGVVERRNRTLVEAARTMLLAFKLPLSFWAEAVATTCYTHNRSIIISTHGKTAYHIINYMKPSIKHLYIFGCICYITRDGENLDKMKEKGDPCVMVGYSTQSKRYRVYNKITCLIVESIHIKFDEIKEMMSDHNTEKTDSSHQELEFLFSPLNEEYYTPAHGHAEENNNDQAPNASFQEDEFINPFCTRVQEIGEPSSRNIDNTDVHSFQPQSHDYRLSIFEPKELKEAMANSAWIEGNADELYQYDRLKVWEQVYKPFGKENDYTAKVFIVEQEGMKIRLNSQQSTTFAKAHKIISNLSYGRKNDISNGPTEGGGLYCSAEGFVVSRSIQKNLPSKEALYGLKASLQEPVQAVCYCARYQARPTQKHLKEVKRIFKYLKGTINMGLWYPKDSGFELTAFSDADHAGCLDTQKSTSGGIQFLGDKLVSWMSKKQNCTAMSSAEAEYVALSASCAQNLKPIIADILRKPSEDRFKILQKINLYVLRMSINIDTVVRLGINPMIQPEPEDLPKDNPKLEIAFLRVILFSTHSDEWKSFQCQHQTALRSRLLWSSQLFVLETWFSSSKPLSPPIPKYQISVCLLFSKPDVRNGMVKSESVQLLSADYTV
ncbi:retrovirus-related pol polyprotein from transposon TNT 1-94 [Tanacetum coccineum]|uniref:Retrovirus-related pol polyprotein from transposon TNT 1-94 n=1 Tax=Tanacetum coccineum TaxID=301880 RepID=A0ABQ4ZGF7_9ASTR